MMMLLKYEPYNLSGYYITARCAFKYINILLNINKYYSNYFKFHCRKICKDFWAKTVENACFLDKQEHKCLEHKPA